MVLIPRQEDLFGYFDRLVSENYFSQALNDNNQMYMLDTNICIYIIKKRPPELLEKFRSIQKNSLCISVVTYAELQYGVERSSSKKMNQRILDEFVSLLDVCSWDPEAARQYGKIRSSLQKKGTPIGNMDLLIAAHALSRNCVLVSNNLREFERIQNLRYENWVSQVDSH